MWWNRLCGIPLWLTCVLCFRQQRSCCDLFVKAQCSNRPSVGARCTATGLTCSLPPVRVLWGVLVPVQPHRPPTALGGGALLSRWGFPFTDLCKLNTYIQSYATVIFLHLQFGDFADTSFQSDLQQIHSHIHTPTAESTTLGDSQLVRSSKGLIMVPCSRNARGLRTRYILADPLESTARVWCASQKCEPSSLKLDEATSQSICVFLALRERGTILSPKRDAPPSALSFVSLETKSYCWMVVHHSLIFPRDGRYLYLPLTLLSLNDVIWRFWHNLKKEVWEFRLW